MKKIISLALLLGLASCGSTPEIEKEIEKNPERELTKDYVLMNASNKSLPTWIKIPSQGDRAKQRVKNRYFVNEAAHKSKRLCIRSASARAAAKIAQEIAQFMKNTYSEASQGGGDEEVSEYMQEQLATESQAFIVGSSVLQTYWEKRSYQTKLGAEEDVKTYNCFALVKMSKTNLEKAVQKSRSKLLNGISNPEVKKKTNKALNMVEKKFSDLEA
ncbi:MAG: hypothetical protein HN576_06575 [Bacteriovoracaceae bacterium]|nr:hypothetical protein [Bacteriovoracaceae bacterium]